MKEFVKTPTIAFAFFVLAAFEENRNHQAAALTASALPEIQDAPLDMAVILASNFRSEKQGLFFILQNLHWKRRVSVNSWRIDEHNEWLREAVPEVDPENPVLSLNLPSGTVVLLQLQPEDLKELLLRQHQT